MQPLFISEYTSTIPFELSGINASQSIPPVVYGHFLKFLCYFHLNDRHGYLASLEDLQLAIAEKYFIKDSNDKSGSYNCLGVAFQLIEKYNLARKAFVESIALLPEPMMNIAYQRLRHVQL